jgi:hypothetical protein
MRVTTTRIRIIPDRVHVITTERLVEKHLTQNQMLGSRQIRRPEAAAEERP